MAFCAVLLCTSSLRHSRLQQAQLATDFSTRTKNALAGELRGEDVSDPRIETEHRPNSPPAHQAPQSITTRAVQPDEPSKSIDVGSAAQVTKPWGGLGGEKTPLERAQDPIREETEEEHTIEQLLNAFLKKSPIIIFSKSYCPFSKQAKNILLERYIIEPAPLVVELDQHPLGDGIQDYLSDLTGRKTVPNILVNGFSIGGGDAIAEMDSKKSLMDKIVELGGKKISIKPATEDQKNV
ncbi:hypothetical protein K3495_g3966 [Podosphaera aphanis]|nr:hypothetical protein K3495_g3966 [Podosphaera aphanis]